MNLKMSETKSGDELLSVMLDTLHGLDQPTVKHPHWAGDFFASLLLNKQTITAWDAGMEVYNGMVQMAMSLKSIKDMSFEGFKKHLEEFVNWKNPAVLRFGYANIRLSLMRHGWDWYDATRYCMECGEDRYMVVGTDSGNGIAWCVTHAPKNGMHPEIDVAAMPMSWAFYQVEKK